MERSVLKILLYVCMFVYNIRPLYSQNTGYITVEQYLKLMDEVQKINESKFNATNNLADVELKISKLNAELRTTTEKHNALEVRTLELEIKNKNSLTELDNLKRKYENLTKSYEAQKTEFKHIEERTNASAWTEFNILEEKYNNVTKMYEKLYSAHQKLEKEKDSPVWTELAVLEGLLQLQEKNLTHNSNEMKGLQLAVDKLQITNNATQKDFTALYNRVLAEEKTRLSLDTNVSELYRLVNKSQNKLDSLYQLQSLCAENITELKKGVNASLESLEVKYGNDIQSIASDVQKLQGQGTLLKMISAAVHKVTLSEKEIKQNITGIILQLDNIIQRHNTSLESVGTNIANLNNSIKSVELNQTVALHSLSNLSRNLTVLGTEIDDKLQKMEGKHNSSINNIMMMVKNNKNNFEGELTKFNSSFQTLVGNLSTARGDLYTFKQKTNNKIETLTKTVSHIEATLSNEIQIFKDESNSSFQAIAKTVSEFKLKLSFIEHSFNRSIDDLEGQIHNITQNTKLLMDNQTLSWKLMKTELNNKIINITKEMDDQIKTLTVQLSSSILDGLDSVKNRSITFQTDITKLVQNIEKEHAQNVSQRESEMQNIIRKISELHNTSIESVNNSLHDLGTRLGTVEGNLMQKISQLSAQTGFNMSALETSIRGALQKIVSRLQSFTSSIGQLHLEVKNIAANLSLTTAMATDNNEKVGLLACSSNAQLSKGSIAHFQNIKTMYGIQNSSMFNSSGKFQCEKPGLYIISAQIMSASKGAAYTIKVNGKELSRVHISPFHDDPSLHNYHTGTGLAVVQLERNDNAWIEVVETNIYVFGKESCINIIKIK